MKIDRLSRVLAALLLALLAGCEPSAEPPQGFAGLGSEAATFTPVLPGRSFSFPADHGPHDGFRIEWWYLTADLKDAQGRRFGVQWTLFRSALRAAPEQPGWSAPLVWLGHAAATSASSHHAAERYARGGVGQAGVTAQPFQAWIDDWRFTSLSSADNPLARMQVQASGPGFAYQLQLSSSRPLVLQGEGGYSRKSDQGQASYYYSQPFFQATGQLQIDGQRYQVSGPAWLDREWSSQPLAADQTGWDWFSLHLDSGERLMLFRVRESTRAPYITGTWINADGSTQSLGREQIRMTALDAAQVEGRRLPIAWHLSIPDKGLDIRTRALNPQSWMNLSIPYWEGPVTLEGSHSGSGYLEMTGY
ncbi:iron ABC transporter permease [Pseudomonas protegens]|uniref:Iron ABC transporter permease n=1 Tax=Pseudomonas protegens TaxID=380021 RepID=A0A7G7XEE9_9PSED|nr:MULTISPECIES: lipocalin-like domain-containing protein [Pseudomonas]MDF2399723.1 iron ABC transporter permease [Pseudomonas sp. 3MA1]QNH78344.1 iron ABC transporter permease [Pseudomonas protegens]QNL07540.1 iron ABC transporter permease [Pseudomonas protegens]